MRKDALHRVRRRRFPAVRGIASLGSPIVEEGHRSRRHHDQTAVSSAINSYARDRKKETTFTVMTKLEQIGATVELRQPLVRSHPTLIPETGRTRLSDDYSQERSHDQIGPLRSVSDVSEAGPTIATDCYRSRL